MPGKKSSDHPSKRAYRTKDGMLDVRRIREQNKIRATVTGTRNLDRAVHQVNVWLKALMEEMNWDSRERALRGLRATLHALRDILPLKEAVNFGAQLPLILKGLYYDGWMAKERSSLQIKTISDFHNLVVEKLASGAAKFRDEDISRLISAVFKIAYKHMGEDELKKIKGLLRKKMRGLIPVSLDDDEYELMKPSSFLVKAEAA